MTLAPLWKFGEVNPITPEFQNLDEGEAVSFMPLETIWPSGRGDYSRSLSWSKKLSYTMFRRGDVLVPKITPTFEAGRTIIAETPMALGVASTEVHVVRAHEHADPRFLGYALRSRPFLDEGAHALQGVGNLRRVTPRFVQEHKLLDADLPTQQRIADYLDLETGEIDAMLGKMDELTETLEARRTSVVDRELLPYAGVSTARLGLVAEAITGLTYAPADVANSGGTVVHRSGSIQNSRIDRSDLIRVTTPIPERLRLRYGDLLVCSRNGSAHLVGKNALIGAEEVGETWGAFMTVLRSANNRYLRWYLQSTLFADERSQYSTSTINQLTIGMINRMEIPFPDSSEQRRIADRLDEVTGKIDQMLAKTAELKALLIERRAALITDVVTGKKQVS